MILSLSHGEGTEARAGGKKATLSPWGCHLIDTAYDFSEHTVLHST